MTPIYQINIRRDAHTTTPVTVPEYEIPILQVLFGEENVHNAAGKRVDENGIGAPVGKYKVSEDEFARLSAKFGAERLESVYGKRATKALEKAVAESMKAKGKKADGGSE